MIEIKKPTHQHPFMLFIDGRESAGSFVERREVGRRGRKKFSYTIKMMDKRDLFSIASLSSNQLFARNIELVEYKNIERLGGYDFRIKISITPEEFLLAIVLESQPLSWDEDFGFKPAQQRLVETFNGDEDTKAFVLGNTTIIQINLIENRAISGVLSDAINRLRNRLFIIFKDLRGDGSLTLTFDFPKEFSSACKQYLIHFADFLTDIGISATADVRNQAGKVLFTVIPHDPKESLDNIRQALEIYLEVAKHPIAPITEEDIASLKLKNEVEHLHAQLSLSKRALEIQDKQAQILVRALEHSHEQQKLLLAKNVSPKAEEVEKDREEVIKGILAVKPLEKEGIEVNLPNIVRWIKKNIFRSQSDNSKIETDFPDRLN